MTRAAIYTRVSVLDDEGVETSTARQEKVCRAFVEAREWEVAEVFTDPGRSAFSGKDRPGWIALERAVRAKEVDTVVVYSISRAARNTLRLLEFVETCEENGVAFESATEPLGGEFAPVLLAILGALAQLESKTKSRRNQDKHDELAANGRWQGGRRPFGFVPVAGRLQVVPREAEAIREGAAAVLNGASLQSVVRSWNAAGLTTAASDKEGRIVPGNPWVARAVRAVLLSPRIAGLRGHDGSLVKAEWPAIVRRGVWDAVVERLEDPARLARATQRGRYLLTGLLRCGVCGGKLTGRPDRGSPGYICKESGRVHLRVQGKALDDYVGDMATLMVPAGAVAVRDPAELAAPILAALETVDGRLAALGGEVARDEIDEVEARGRRAEYRKQKASLEAQLDELGAVPVREFVFKQHADGSASDEWRAMLETRIDHVEVAAAKRGRNSFDAGRVRIVWRAGVEPIPEERLASGRPGWSPDPAGRAA